MIRATAKEMLYSVIDAMGKERLKMDLIANIESSKNYIKRILEECFSDSDETDDSRRGDLCEALLHFLLTVLSIPSERKVGIGKVNLDIVIPSLKELKNKPDRAIVIQVVRQRSDYSLLADAQSVQPVSQNLWVVSSLPLTSQCKLYDTLTKPPSFANIIVDLQSFLVEKGINRLKLLSD